MTLVVRSGEEVVRGGIKRWGEIERLSIHEREETGKEKERSTTERKKGIK